MKHYVFSIFLLIFCSSILMGNPLIKNQVPKEKSKIAVVNAEKVYEKYVQRSVYEKNLKEIANKAESELEKLNEKRINSRRDYDKARDEADANFIIDDKIMSAKRDNAQKLYRIWKTNEMDCESFAKNFKEKQKFAFEEMREKLKNEINDAIRSRATLDGYEMVLDSSAKSMTELNVVLYSVQRLDLTDKVIEDLNKGR